MQKFKIKKVIYKNSQCYNLEYKHKFTYSIRIWMLIRFMRIRIQEKVKFLN
jgi:hypothetical protein